MKSKLFRCKLTCVDSYKEKLIKLQTISLIQNLNNLIEAEKKCQVDETWKTKVSLFLKETLMPKNLLRCLITQMKLQEPLNKNLELFSSTKLKARDQFRLLIEVLMSLITELSTTVNGQKKDLEMAKVHKFGKMAVSIPGTGRLIKLTEKEDLYMLMEMLMRVTGLTIKPKEEVLTNMLTEQSM